MNEKQIEKEVYNFLNGVSETTKVYFEGGSTKNPLEYRVGEEMVFKLRVKCEGNYVDVPCIKYTIEGDDGEKVTGFKKPDADGWFYLTTSLKRDGFVRVIAEAYDEEENKLPRIDKFEGGAGADIEKITLATEIPEDYFEFWDWLKKETEAVAPEVIYEREFEHEKYPNYEFRDMRIKVTEDEYASCLLAWPKNATAGSLKLRYSYRGYGVSAFNEIWGIENTMLIATNAHCVPNHESPEYFANLKETTLKGFGFDKEENADPKTTYWAKMFRRNYQVFRYFKNHPLVNGRDIIFSGGSMGAMQAINMAAHTGCATECIAMVPWFSDLGAGENLGRLTGWRPAYLHGVKYFDTAVAARFIKCPISITAGLGDYVCPPSGQMALYNGVTTKKNITFIQNRTHSYHPIEEVTYKING